jgi:hypothetical protein
LLVKWWADYPGDLLERRVVRPLQDYLTSELVVTKKLTVSVMNVIKVLAKVEEANQLGRQLPPEAFYNELIRSADSLAACPGHWTRAASIVTAFNSASREEDTPLQSSALFPVRSRFTGGACTLLAGIWVRPWQ